MARRSQCSDAGDNPLDPNYLPPHYREEYRLAIDALVEEDVEGYFKFLQLADVVDFLSPSEIDYIQNFVQLPKQSGQPEHRFLDTGGDGSSDTYWPLHSDLDAPGLDLGWPQIHHFIGPTEVTTLVNPAAPDMPSIKEQARRLIKNAQMVIAIVMDMFTDVDIFADILNAAMRNVAVYILLDEANVDHFINMVNNCRVNLQAIQFLRVRTVSGITYHCRSGKSFKGQMLDRFLLTDCRAVLSGNYSFMWSYEKLHRCMAHLFLGQLVSTFDEEFRILFAQSDPLNIENMEDTNVLQKRNYPGERPMLGDTRKYRTLDTGHPEDWSRQPYEEMDRRLMSLKRQETFHGPMDMYGRFSSQQKRQDTQTRLDPQSRLDLPNRLDPQTRLEPPLDQGPHRMPMMEGLAHKRHGGPGRYSLPYQQGFSEAEPPGRQFYRNPQLHPGHEPDYGGYDKFWNQDFHQEEQYPEPGYAPEIEPHENFDPVLNYLSSTRNMDVDQSSDKLIPGPDLPYTPTHPRRAKLGQPYACQTSPTPSNTTEKKFHQEHSSDRKDPTVKQGLRNWRISSYLSAYDDSGEPEGLPMGQGQSIDPFEEMPNPIQQPLPPPVFELNVPKIPNVREFKVPVLPRPSQIPAFAKTPRDLSKKVQDEFPSVVVPEIKTTPTPSESSSTTDGEKQEDLEPREPITSVLRREDSFRRKYNAAMHRSSRLRSSLIFSSLDQNTTQDNKAIPSEQEDDGIKTEAEQAKLPFVSQVLAQRRSGAREPFEWRNYIKTSDNAKPEEDNSNQPEKNSDSKLESLPESEDVGKSQEVAPSVEKVDVGLLPKPSEIDQPKIEQPAAAQPASKSFLIDPFVDMNDPDQRLLFFKELAAKRKAEKLAELKQEKAPQDKKDKAAKEEVLQKEEKAQTAIENSKKVEKESEAKTLDVGGTTDRLCTVGKQDPTSVQSCEEVSTKSATDSDKIASKQSQAAPPLISEKKTEEKLPSQNINASKPAVTKDEPSDAPVASAPANVKSVTEENLPATSTDATSKDLQLTRGRSIPDFAKLVGSDLLSSLPSSRIYERSISQDVNKEVQPKSRLWSPSLHKRELLKPLVDKQKCISTVIQIEDNTEDPSQTYIGQNQEISGVKLDISDPTQPKESPMEEPVGKTATSSTQNETEKSAGLTKAMSQHPQNEKTEKSVSDGAQLEDNRKTVTLPTISDLVQPLVTQNEDKLVQSASETKDVISVQSQTKGRILPETITPAVKEGTKDSVQPKALQATTKDKTTELSMKEQMNMDSLVKPAVNEESRTQSLGSVESPKQDKSTAPISDQTQPRSYESQVKSSGSQNEECSRNNTSVQSVASGELPPQENPKTEEKQSLDQSDKSDKKSTCSVVQVEDSTPKPLIAEQSKGQETFENIEPNQPEKLEEKSNVDESSEKSSQKEEARSIEKPDKLPSIPAKVSLQQSGKEDNVEDNVQNMATSSGIDNIKDTTQFQPVQQKSGIPPKEDSNLSNNSVSKDCVIHEKSSSIMPTEKTDQVDPISQCIEEAKQKTTVPYGEEFTQLESHSNTSSPASFATALEFISSEETDLLSPARNDPHYLFKSGNVESVSDSSDFETPSSDFCRSPMPLTINMDETTEDNVSIAETVIEAASRRISAATEDVDSDSPQSSQQSSPKEKAQFQPPQEHLPPEITSDSNLKAAVIQSEAKGSLPDVTTHLATTTEIDGSDSPVQNKMAKSNEDEKTVESEMKQVASEKQIEVNKATVESTSQTPSQVQQEAKMANQASPKEMSSADKKISTESQSDPSKACISTKANIQDKTSQLETKTMTSELNKETVVSSTNPALCEDQQDTMVDNKSVKSTDLAVSTEKSESETKALSSNTSPASQSQTSSATSEETNKVKTSDKVSEESNIDCQNEIIERSDVPVVINSELESKLVPSKTQMEPSNPSTETAADKASEQVADGLKIDNKSSETNKQSGPTGETNLESKTKTSKKSTEVRGQNLEISGVKGESEFKKAGPGQQDNTPEISSPKTLAPAEKSSTDRQTDGNKEPNAVAVKSEPKHPKVSETAPPTAQPKQQPKPNQSRYLSSTANVISSSNLRDDTKILLEQISANSQNRNETANNEVPVTDDEKEDKADKNAKRKLGQQKPSQDRDKLLERIQTMRKDRKVYSRFEV